MTPSWYDVLDVEPDASTEDIRTAWRAAVADLDPTDRRFRSLNKAAEVLLDPERRASHDADLAADRDDEPLPSAPDTTAAATPSTAETTSATAAGDGSGAVALGTTDAAVRRPTARPRRPQRGRSTSAPSEAATSSTSGPVLLTKAPRPERPGGSHARLVALTAVLAVLAVILVAATALAAVRRPHELLPDTSDVAAAQAAAETAIGPVLSYDYRHLAQSEAAATSYMTPSFASVYRRYFTAAVQNNAGPTKTIVGASVITSGIVRTGPGQVDVLLFVNQPQTNKGGTKTEYNQVTARMVHTGNRWLVNCLVTTLNGVCGSP